MKLAVGYYLKILKMSENLIEVRNLKKYFYPSGWLMSLSSPTVVKAVDGVSFDIKRSKTFGIVGESGCGKTTLANMILGLQNPTEGDILYKGEKIRTIMKGKPNYIRRSVQAVFQDPYSSLNPWMRVGSIISEPLVVHKACTRDEIKTRVVDLLEAVGLPADCTTKYPNEFSGGQRQRIAIARAIALNPELVVLDEPVARLDLSMRSQIINLLIELQRENGLTYLQIGHDLPLVAYVSDFVGVMYLGKFVEICQGKDLVEWSLHPYTRTLISAIPIPDPSRRTDVELVKGEPANPINLPAGCRFHPRCPRADKICVELDPVFRELDKGHFIACHHV